MKKIRKTFVLVLILMVTLMTMVRADTPSKILINKALMADGKVYVDFQTNQINEDFYSFLALYDEGVLKEVKSLEHDSTNSRYLVSNTIANNYDSIKMYFADKVTLSPLDKGVEIVNTTNLSHTVRFVNESNAVISSQNILSGGTALSPASLTKSGYLFAGWSDEYDMVSRDLMLSPVFMADGLDNIFKLSSIDTNSGKQIVVTLSVEGTVKLCALEMSLRYDSDKLEYVSSQTLGALDPVANHIKAESKVILNAASLSNRTLDSDILKLTFNVKNIGPTDTFVEISDYDNIRVAYTDAQYNLFEANYHIINSIVRIR